MINNSFLVAIFLLTVEILVISISESRRFKKWFKFLPAVFWIYFLPMLCSTCGLIKIKDGLYTFVTSNLLPGSLFLLLLSSDIRAILKLGGKALIMMFAGCLGIVIGAPLIFSLFRPLIGYDFWSGFGALAASWTGGSANMIAAKEALGTPDAVFLPMVIVDTVVPYFWMGTLIALAGFQAAYDKFNNSDCRVLDDLRKKTEGENLKYNHRFNIKTTALIISICAVASFASCYLGRILPAIKDVISAYAWTIIIVSILGVWASFTPLRKLENFGASRIGYLILYFVLTAIGARANLSNINAAFILIFAGIILVLFHGLVLLAASRLLRAPMFLAACASQANIGGVASAPVVAAVYQPGLASVGLLMAILGNIVGTYMGIISGQLCKLFVH